MKIGNLVRIKSNEHLGLFVIMAHGEDRRWAKIMSLSTSETAYEMLRSLEVINENR